MILLSYTSNCMPMVYIVMEWSSQLTLTPLVWGVLAFFKICLVQLDQRLADNDLPTVLSFAYVIVEITWIYIQGKHIKFMNFFVHIEKHISLSTKGSNLVCIILMWSTLS